MSAPELKEGLANQRAASDPDNSVWVVANAGSGKTYVLTSRIVRLLLAGARPSAILCLTFTKAAAAEMRDRLSRLLAHWATCADETLDGNLRERLGRAPTEQERKDARTLFARVIDAPGSLRIQTIHSFCEALLKQFPVEARVPPHFSIADEGVARELLGEARERLIADASGNGDLARALRAMAERAGETSFAAAIDALLGGRRRLRDLLARKGGDIGAAIGELYALLQVTEGETPDAAFVAHVAGADRPALQAAAAALATGSTNDTKLAGFLGEALDAPDDGARLSAWLNAFLTKQGEPRKKFATKAVDAAYPRTNPALLAEQTRVLELAERLSAIAVAGPSAALLRVGAALFARYDALKASRALLDYDDLVLRAVALLRGATPWVLYKLDGGIDHILVDEAQDTAPEQWAAVATLVGEFFAGEGARARMPSRSIFVVGDEKQSIFSFQGADLAAFAQTRATLQAKAGRNWKEVPLEISFRSAPAVLEAVDRVFADPTSRSGVVTGERDLTHRPMRSGAGGRVELWAPELAADHAEPQPWDAPVDYVPADHPSVRLAQRIARTVAGWIGKEELPARGRKVRAGDVLVLVRRRNRFFDACVRAFKDAGVPVAGADRMVLGDQIAVMDMLSLARFCLMPADDLSLAEVLKSPLYGFDDDDLFALAWKRERHLWATLRARATENAKWAAACAELGAILARADFTAPYELFADLLNARDGRRRMLARLGPDAADPLDEFLSACLVYERVGPASLQGFVAWFEAGGTDIKRDMEQGRDEVRVMTVHGAKGLEAEIVFLPDTCTLPGTRDPIAWAADVPLWPPKGNSGQKAVAAARADAALRDQAEYRRLLYVAMTRARDRLYVCGWTTDDAPKPGSWYSAIEPVLKSHAETVEVDTPDGPVWRIDRPTTIPDSPVPAALALPAPKPVPDWATGKIAPFEPSPPRPLVPSRPESEPSAASPLGADAGFGFVRGRLIHRLLQTLPDLAPAARADAAKRFLARPGHGLDPAQIDEMAAETLAVLADPQFGPAFDGSAIAEAPVVARIGARALAGRIDRLAVRAEEILIVDFKTNRPPPSDVAAVSPAYIGQLAAYREALKPLFAGRPIRCALLWTYAPRLMHIPDALLDRFIPK
ncbi:MAG: double-strand break repair helicase AddA [Alphaproteobacteria bacterium]|nr:double-strand break repair helicase AddA [Alphaproteobacteria bacterium]